MGHKYYFIHISNQLHILLQFLRDVPVECPLPVEPARPVKRASNITPRVVDQCIFHVYYGYIHVY